MSLVSIRNKTNQASKGFVWVAVAALILVGGFGGIFNGFSSMFSGKTPIAPESSPEDTVAKVNGVSISRSSYDQSVKQEQDQMAMYGGGANGSLSAGEIHSQALNRLIQQTLLIQIAKKAGLEATQSDIDAVRNKELTSIKSELGLSPNASQNSVETALAKVGESLDHILPPDKLADQALAEKYEATITREATPNDAAVDAYYTGLHTEHILISNKTRPDAQALDQAKKLIAQIDAAKGANFEALAKQYSDDLGTKAKGGDDGWQDGTSDYVADFMNAARTLKAGQWTETPVATTQFGYFIIKLLGTRDDKPKDFAKKHADYVSQIASSIADKRRQADMDAAQKTMKVAVLDPQLNGDWLLFTAFKNAGGVGKPSDADANAALGAYQKALKSASNVIAKSEIEAQEGILYRVLNRPDDQLASFVASETDGGDTDPGLALQIGDLYKGKKDTANAVKYYKIASSLSYDNVQIHAQLQQSFKALGQTDLAAAEAKKVADLQAAQKAAASTASFGGQPINIAPHR